MTIETSRHPVFASAVRAVLHTPRDVSAPTRESPSDKAAVAPSLAVRCSHASSEYEIQFKVALYHPPSDFEEAYYAPTLDMSLRETDWSSTMLILSKMVRELAPMYAGDRIMLTISSEAWTYSYEKIVERNDRDLFEIANQIERKA